MWKIDNCIHVLALIKCWSRSISKLKDLYHSERLQNLLLFSSITLTELEKLAIHLYIFSCIVFQFLLWSSFFCCFHLCIVFLLLIKFFLLFNLLYTWPMLIRLINVVINWPRLFGHPTNCRSTNCHRLLQDIWDI